MSCLYLNFIHFDMEVIPGGPAENAGVRPMRRAGSFFFFIRRLLDADWHCPFVGSDLVVFSLL